MANTITLTKRERMKLMRRATSRTERTEDARRAQVILLLAEGRDLTVAYEHVACSRGFVSTWSKCFAKARLAGPYTRHRGQSQTRLTPRIDTPILDATRRCASRGSTHWSIRKLTAQLGVNHMRVAQV